MSEDNTPERLTERWVFGGSRVGQKNKRFHAWIDPDMTRLIFQAQGSYSVGAVYEVTVTRECDSVTMHGRPRYHGRNADTELLDELAAEHRAAELALSEAARERAAKDDDPIERAIQRLAELTQHMPPAQRPMFAAWVAARLSNVWQQKTKKTKPTKRTQA
jgi:hypothetical protein